jgi:anti-sigma factor RsiW
VNDDVHEFIGAYATDSVSADERAAFEAHLPSCPACRAELAEFREVLARLASTTAVVPPAHLGTAVMTTTDATTRESQPGSPSAQPRPTARPSRRPARGRWIAAAAAGAVLFAGGALLGRSTAPGSSLPAGADAVAMDSLLAVTSAQDATLLAVDLMGTESRVVVSGEMGKAVFLASNLPTPAKGMCYQVWAVAADGTKSSAGLFVPDAAGHVAAVLRADPGATSYVITVEPPGGSTKPTGEMVGIVDT